MKYTNYLSVIVSSHGLPNMNNEQFKRIMNVVHLEGRLKQLIELKKEAVRSPEPSKFDIEIFTQKERLKVITQGIEPKQFIHELLSNPS